MRKIPVRALPAIMIAAAFSFTSVSCAQLGALDELLGAVLGGPGGGEAVVQVLGVDTRRQQIQVRTQDGQQGGVLYDQQTRVLDPQGRYIAVRQLQRGMVVAMRVHEVQQGYYAEIVQVRDQQPGAQQPQQPGTGQIQGNVGAVDRAAGRFELESLQGPTVVIVMPQNPAQTDQERFNRLERGAVVNVEVRQLTEREFELIRFVQ